VLPTSVLVNNLRTASVLAVRTPPGPAVSAHRAELLPNVFLTGTVSVAGTSRSGAPPSSCAPARMDLQDDAGASSMAEQEILIDVTVPVTVNSDPIVPHGNRCRRNEVSYLARSCNRRSCGVRKSSRGAISLRSHSSAAGRW
jgi:hypothetical protein